MSTREFLVCVGGLSEAARFPPLFQATPVRADSPEAIAALFGSYNG